MAYSYVDEFSKAAFNSVASIHAINQNLKDAEMQAIWLVVPDKSTVYLGRRKLDLPSYVNPWKSLERMRLLGIPNLDEQFIQESYRVKDLYAPTTHI